MGFLSIGTTTTITQKNSILVSVKLNHQNGRQQVSSLFYFVKK